MSMRDSSGEALHRHLDSGRVGTELHAVLKARQWVGRRKSRVASAEAADFVLAMHLAIM